MLGAYADELLWVLGLFVAVVIVAAMVNRFRPMLRPRLRRLVTVFALFTAATGLGVGFRVAGLASWGNGCLVAAEILQAFTLISLSATLVNAWRISAATGIGGGCRVAGLASWGNGCLVAAEILQAFTLISLSATLVNVFFNDAAT